MPGGVPFLGVYLYGYRPKAMTQFPTGEITPCLTGYRVGYEETLGLQHQPRDKNEHDTSRLMEAYNMLNIPNESLQDYVQHIGSLPNNFY